ncbi:Spore maturation protein A [compost metagenome]
MLNKIWPFLIIVSIGYGVFFGNIQDLNNSIFSSSQSVIEVLITLVGTLCLWNGILEIAINTKILDDLSKLLKPVVNYLFPDTNNQIKKKISMNMLTNILGMGNASTPIGLQVMEDMQKENKDKKVITKDMAMFIVINTASIQLIPTTIIAIRSSLGSKNPTSIIVPVWIATIAAATTAIILCKIFISRRN